MFNDKSILITGGTGSFGRAYTKYLLENFKPRRLIIYSRDEQKQFEMSHTYNDSCMRYFIGDVRDLERLTMAMQGVDYVIHAAAMKIVPAAEYNPMECIKTNIHGAENIIKAVTASGVKKVVALSTDKAANPINLYGATKLASDKLIIAGNNIKGANECMLSVVRYGKVVGSRGSILPYFRKLMNEGIKEFPITDARMTRFWITLDQGVQFVTNAFLRMQGGEIFVPKIPSILMTDLALSLDSKRPHKIIGIRPGEKLHEIMCPKDDCFRTIEFADHYVICPTINFTLPIDYYKNSKGEIGQDVKDGFEYNSLDNPHFLTVDEIRALNEAIK
jgi:UDP-N-acetylglucosamine 4,6-dehydratase